MNLIERGIEQCLIKFDVEKKNISYLHQNKKYRYTDPEEQVRAKVYLSLVFEYKYDPDLIDFEVRVPHRTPNNLADIVVFKDNAMKEPFIVVECKQPEISEAEFSQAIEQGFGNANSLLAPYILITSEIKDQAYKREDFPSMEREENKISSLPENFSKIISKAKYIKGDEFHDLNIIEEDDLKRVFKQAHDALWAGGKRNPSEAFDELDKLIFCKIWDERKRRKDVRNRK